MHSELLLVVVVGAALSFDFTNGFHDTANVVASAISTRALAPRTAIALASILNFVGAFVSLKVAATIATGIIDAGQVTETIAFAGLIGAIAWNLITWMYGLPSSSSHALIGGVIGAMLAAVGGGGVKGSGVLDKVVIPALIAPVSAFLVAAIVIVIIYRVFGRRRPGPVTRGFRLGQIVTSAVLAFAHGTNDAQKTMGVITLALVAHGSLSAHHVQVPTWVVICAATAISLGTYAGGWRIIRTVGSRIIKMDTAQGFAAQGRGGVRDPALLAPRLSALLHARDLRGRDGRGRRQAGLGRPLGRGRLDRRRLGDHAADRGAVRRRRLRDRLGFRHGGCRTGGDDGGGGGRPRHDARGPPPSMGGGRERLSQTARCARRSARAQPPFCAWAGRAPSLTVTSLDWPWRLIDILIVVPGE